MIPLVLIVVLALILIFKDDRKEVPVDQTKLTSVVDYNEYFGITKLMNDYLNEDDKGSQEYTFYITDLEAIKLENNTYYFISGDKVTYDYKTSKMRLLENDCYLVSIYLINKNYKIDKINSIDEYYSNNKFYDNVEVKTNKTYYEYASTTVSNDYVGKYYINYFKDLLFVNYTKAYSILDSSYKNKFNGMDDFNNQRESIYNKLNLNITNYSIKGDNGKKTLKVVLDNGTTITFKENCILNYTVSIENNG